MTSFRLSFAGRICAFTFVALLLGGFGVKAASGLYDFNGSFQQTHPFARPAMPQPYGAQYGAPPQPQPQQYQYAPQPQQYQYAPQRYAAPPTQGWGGAAQFAPPPPPAPAQAQAPDSAQFKFNEVADEPAKREGWHGISEIRLGAVIHDFGPFSHRKENGTDANLAILFDSPDFLDIIWSPRPQIGGNYSFIHDTSQAYLGIVWEWDFWDNYFFGFGWGGAYHSGKVTTEDRKRKELGCKILFREDFDLGYRFNENHNIALHFDHISNAKLCHTNEGLENVGIRYGYRF